MKYRTSPERYSFHLQCDKKNLEEGKITQENYDEWKSFLEKVKSEDAIPTTDLPDLEYELRTSDYIHNKCVSSENYCKDLYAALCNNEFTKIDKICSYTWRTAGGIISHILEKGDYIDWYLSGNEGHVTDEVEKDIADMGWKIIPIVIGG